jgi:hypothetical protein
MSTYLIHSPTSYYEQLSSTFIHAQEKKEFLSIYNGFYQLNESRYRCTYFHLLSFVRLNSVNVKIPELVPFRHVS